MSADQAVERKTGRGHRPPLQPIFSQLTIEGEAEALSRLQGVREILLLANDLAAPCYDILPITMSVMSSPGFSKPQKFSTSVTIF